MCTLKPKLESDSYFYQGFDLSPDFKQHLSVGNSLLFTLGIIL